MGVALEMGGTRNACVFEGKKTHSDESKGSAAILGSFAARASLRWVWRGCDEQLILAAQISVSGIAYFVSRCFVQAMKSPVILPLPRCGRDLASSRKSCVERWY